MRSKLQRKSSAKAEETCKLLVPYFKRWLRANNHRLSYKIVGTESKYGHTNVFRFSGISENIQIWLTAHSLSVAAVIDEHFFDFLIDLDVYPDKNPAGKIVCRECVRSYEDIPTELGGRVKRPKTFQNLEDLYSDHLFEPLLDWSKKNLRHNRFLYFDGYPGQTGSYATIVPIAKILAASGLQRVTPVVTFESPTRCLTERLNIRTLNGKVKRLYVV
jgi:hypothetical protein